MSFGDRPTIRTWEQWEVDAAIAAKDAELRKMGEEIEGAKKRAQVNYEMWLEVTRKRNTMEAERDAALAEIEKVKTVEFPHKVEAVAKATYLKGLETAKGVVACRIIGGRAWNEAQAEEAAIIQGCSNAIQFCIDEAKKGDKDT